MTRLLRPAVALLLTVALTACGGDARSDAGAGSGTPTGVSRADQSPLSEASAVANPLAGKTFYLDPDNPARQQAAQWTAQQRAADAQAIRRIGDRPVAHWLAGGDTTADVDAYLTKAAAAGHVPVLVAYNIPNRDCGSYSAGGAGSPDAYRAWIRGVVAGLKGRPAVVIVEPDAVAHAVDGCKGKQEERFGLLRDAVAALKSSANSLVYVDAGHPAWIGDIPRLADALKKSGVMGADGFSLNVSNFIRTPENLAYGDRLSAALDGRRFVVDTSRNGAGPAGGPEISGGPSWCNPPGRVLGSAPTTDTGHPKADALLWVKRPGESDGACRPGEPAAGQWWPDYALDLAKRSP